jgi:hypothetical protein
MANDLALYQLADEYLQAVERLSDMDLDDQTVADTLESLQGDMETKVVNVSKFIKNLEATSDAIAIAENAMHRRRQAIENRVERIKHYLKFHMERTGMSRIDSPWFKVAIRTNPPSVVIDAAPAIPCEFYVYPEAPAPYPDKKAIAKAIKDGQEVPGAHLEQSTRVEIK